jgi:hypothetical protein
MVQDDGVKYVGDMDEIKPMMDASKMDCESDLFRPSPPILS